MNQHSHRCIKENFVKVQTYKKWMKSYHEPNAWAYIMNKCYQWKSNFNGNNAKEIRATMDKTEVNMSQIRKIIQIIQYSNTRKAMGPENLSNWILYECSKQLIKRIHSIIVTLLEKAEVTSDWKQSNIIPIFKWWKKGAIQL